MLYSNQVYILLLWFGHRILILQKDCLSYKKNTKTYLKKRWTYTDPLFKDCNILKFHDKIALENSILIHKSFKHELPQPSNSWFGLSSDFHTHTTRWSNLGCRNAPSHRTKLYGRNYVCISAIFTWNYLQNLYRNILFHELITISLKKLLALQFLRKYVWHEFSDNSSSFTLTASKTSGFLFDWNWHEILFSCFSVAFEEGLVEVV